MGDLWAGKLVVVVVVVVVVRWPFEKFVDSSY